MSETKDIKRGFNHGYLLKKYSPDLAKTVLETLKDQNSAYALGFQKGSAEYQKEKTKTKPMNYQLKKHHLPKSPSKDKAKDRDLDK